MTNSYTVKLDPKLAESVRRFLAQNEFEFSKLANALWVAKGVECRCTFYRSGKLLIQGKEAELWRGLLQDVDASLTPFYEGLSLHPTPSLAVWIGSDESGKGDYFGPLVVCAARVHRAQLAQLSFLGVQDSKSLSDARIMPLAKELSQMCRHQIVKIGNSRYNELYPKFNNLNRMMSWAHAKAIHELAKEKPVDWILIDRFASPELVDKRLMKDGWDTPITHRTKAESDPAVAVASIIARAAYLKALEQLSYRYDQKLSPGAGPPIIQAGKALVKRHGKDVLAEVAKLHFATTEKVT